MYITLAWSIHPPTDPDDVEGELFAATNVLAFTKVFNAHDNVILANVKGGHGREIVQDLHDAIKAAAAGRYSYVITVSPNFWDMAESPDLDAVTLQSIVDYKTT